MSSVTSIHTGVWTNWSHSAIVGTVVTLPTRGGAILLVFLALYVSIAGGKFWNIICFVAHQYRARKKTKLNDGLFHQQQVILRNSGDAVGVAWELFRASFRWRKEITRSCLGSLWLVGIAILNLIAFLAAGLLTSEVTRAAGAEALVRSKACGFWDIPLTVSGAPTQAWQTKVLNETVSAATYARNCYQTAEDPLHCRTYTVQQIGWKTNPNVTCPFASGMCYFSDTAAYEMDTGPIDSHIHLGLNTPKSERITYRKVTTCAPLHTKKFTKLVDGTYTINGSPRNTTFVRIHFGMIGTGPADWTFQYNTNALVDEFEYQLTSYVANPGYNGLGWNPIDELSRADADVSVFFLTQNGVTYNTPVDDPWFSAHEESSGEVGFTTITWYLRDYPVNVLGCIDQHQFCDPMYPDFDGASLGCTDLTSYQGAIDQVAYLPISTLQLNVAGRVISGLFYDNMYYSVFGRGASALRASETVSQLTQLATLTNHQWVIEINNWFATILARTQQSVLEYATPNLDLPAGGKIVSQHTRDDTLLCHAQKIQAPNGYQNFSLLGIVIIIVLGTIIIVLGTTIDSVVGACQSRWSKDAYGPLAWALDEKLQLQRMAYEGAGWSGWDNCDSAVPIYSKGRDLGQYTTTEKSHPTIQRAGE